MVGFKLLCGKSDADGNCELSPKRRLFVRQSVLLCEVMCVKYKREKKRKAVQNGETRQDLW